MATEEKVTMHDIKKLPKLPRKVIRLYRQGGFVGVPDEFVDYADSIIKAHCHFEGTPVTIALKLKWVQDYVDELIDKNDMEQQLDFLEAPSGCGIAAARVRARGLLGPNNRGN